MRAPERYGLHEDFDGGVDLAYRWVLINPDSGDALAQDAPNGVVLLTPSDTTVADNDEVYLASALQRWRFEGGRPLSAGCRLRWQEAVANAANVIFGLVSSPGVDMLADNGGGPRASGNMVVLYKRDGDTKWRAQVRDAFGYQDAASTVPAGAVAVREVIDGHVVSDNLPWAELMIDVRDPEPALTVRDRLVVARLWADGVMLAEHRLSQRDAADMSLVVGVKNGSATQESLYVDWVGADQVRRRY